MIRSRTARRTPVVQEKNTEEQYGPRFVRWGAGPRRSLLRSVSNPWVKEGECGDSSREFTPIQTTYSSTVSWARSSGRINMGFLSCRFTFSPYISIYLPLHLPKIFIAELDLVLRVTTFCLFWPSHLNFKLLQKRQWAAAPHSPSLCNSILQTLTLSPLSHLFWTEEWQSTESLLVLKLFIQKFIDPSCYPLWTLSGSAAFLFSEEELKCTEYARLPWLPDTVTFSNPAAPRKSQTSWKKSWSALCSAATKILTSIT